MQSQKNDIIEKAGQLFNRFGVKSITMDDIAREMGISKKTLYLHFSGKTDLINSLIEESKNELVSRIKQVEDNDKGGLEKLYQIYLELVGFYNESNTVSYWSFKKYYRDLFNEFSDFVADFLDKICEKHIEEAQWDNSILPDIDARMFVSFLRKSLMDLREDEEIKTNTNKESLQKDFVYYNLRSIATVNGIEQLDKLRNL